MSNRINVLVFPCGSEVGIEIHAALKDVVTVNLYGASGKHDHGSFVYKNYIDSIPYITDKKFLQVFNDLLERYKIDIVFPTHEDIALFLGENSDQFSAKIAIPGVEQARICRSKKATYELFQNDDFSPVYYNTVFQVKKYPVFAKPDKGQGGKGALLIHNEQDFLKINNDSYVITEYLPGEELTVDCFSDKENRLRFVGPRRRNRVFGGISVNSITISPDEEITKIATAINEKMKMRGLWYFQLKKDTEDKYKLLEVSVRVSGTMNLYRGLGVNFPLLTVYDIMGYKVDVISNDYMLEVDRALTNRYRSNLKFDTIYIDFDDTVTKNGKVNPHTMLFLYHARNNGKIIKLITKHEHVLSETLKQLLIDPRIFDEIIHIEATAHKHEVINTTSRPIFIDNAYKERALVKQYLNIPVFDVDAITTLIDWKE